LDDAKVPARAFSVRCPKCQASINAQPPASNGHDAEPAMPQLSTATENSLSANPNAFAKPETAPRFNVESEKPEAVADSAAGLSDIAKLLAEALRHTDSRPTTGRARPAWDRRKALVCSSPAYRETIADSLARHGYDVFVAENMAQGLGRMREERMDVIVLDANFDPVEQGVAFITREVRLLRPSERRRLFFVYLTSGVRTMDLHAAFLHNVNLVVNPSDVEQLPDALDISIRQYNELYKPLYNALDIAPI
jgi:CheY-like chemotaxis protein